VEQMRLLVRAVIQLDLPFASEQNKSHAHTLLNLPHGHNVWSGAIGAAIKSLWADPSVLNVFSRATSL